MKLAHHLATLLGMALLAAPSSPCSAFLVCGDGRILFGNNEDYWDTATRLWFVPARDGRHGVAYLGYANLFPQGGMNDAGLAFDGFATEENPLHQQDGKEPFQWSLLNEAMETCTTVTEVVALLGRHDLGALSRSMLFYADATGDSVIVEGDVFLRKQGSFQVVTNVYQSQCDARATCPRFAAATEMLEQRTETSPALCRQVLAKTAQESGAPTQYSNVFDLQKRRISLYHFHDFEDPLELDLAEELAKGERVLEIPSLFRPTYAFQVFQAQRERIEAEKQARATVSVPAETLDAYAGTYGLEIPGQGPARFAFRRDGAKLLVESERFLRVGSRKEFELAALSEHEFLLEQPGWKLTFAFTRGDAGLADELEVRSERESLHGRRVAEDTEPDEAESSSE